MSEDRTPDSPQAGSGRELDPAVAEMEKAIGALAYELPAEVWADVRDRWHRVRDARDEELALSERRNMLNPQATEYVAALEEELAGLRQVAEAAQNVDLVYVGIARRYPSEGDWTVFHDAADRLHAALAALTPQEPT